MKPIIFSLFVFFNVVSYSQKSLDFGEGLSPLSLNAAKNQYTQSMSSLGMGALSSRVTGMKTFTISNGKLVLYDSVLYVWLGSNGSTQNGSNGNVNVLDADTTYTFRYSAGNYPPYMLRISDYSVPNSVGYEWKLWDASNKKWMNYGKQTIRYNTSGIMLDFLTLNWNTVQNRWDSSSRYLYQYNDTIKIDYLYQDWTANNITYTYNHTHYTYSGSSLTEEVSEVWNKTKGKPQYTNRNIYQYTGNNVTKIIGQRWNLKTNSWRDDSRTDKTYTGADVTGDLIYSWDTIKNMWAFKDSISYHITANKVTGSIRYSWSKGSGSWLKSYSMTSVYSGQNRTYYTDSFWNGNSVTLGYNKRDSFDVLGNNTAEISAEWNTKDKAMRNKSYISRKFSGANETDYIGRGWDTLNKSWLVAEHKTHNFDGNGNLKEIIQQLGLTTGQVVNYKRSVLTTDASDYYTVIDYYIWDGNNWIYEPGSINQVQYNYESYTTSAVNEPKQNAEGIKVYPNPVSDYLCIKGTKSQDAFIEIYDMNGKLIYQNIHCSEDGNVDLTGLSAGTFMIQIRNNVTCQFLRTIIIKL